MLESLLVYNFLIIYKKLNKTNKIKTLIISNFNTIIMSFIIKTQN